MQEQAENVSSTLQSHLRVSMNDNGEGKSSYWAEFGCSSTGSALWAKEQCLDLFIIQEPERRTEKRELRRRHEEKVCYRYTG